MKETMMLHRGNVECSLEQANYDPAALQRLDDHYAALIDKKTIQGASYILARHGKVFAHTSMGKQTHLEGSLDLLPGAIRKTNSITKIVTAIAIMQLVERGHMHLLQYVSSILKPFDTGTHRTISIAQLLTHTSGLRGDPGCYMEPYTLPWYEWAYSELKKQNDTTDWMRVVLSGRVMAAPGKEWHYSTSGYAVLGEIITHLSGMPYHEYIEQHLLRPLGMHRSFFLVPPELREEVCVTSDWEEARLATARFEEHEPPKAGNGLYSTLQDLCTLGQMMLSGGSLNGVKILSKRSVKQMTTNQLSNVSMQCWDMVETNYKFGLGLSLDDFDLCTPGTFNHEGHGHCGLYVDPVEELIFAFFVPSARGYATQSVLVPKAIVWSGLR